MPEVYDIKIKKEYAAALIDDHIKVDAVEDIDSTHTELPQSQIDALNKELQAIADNPDYTIPWDSIINRFKERDAVIYR